MKTRQGFVSNSSSSSFVLIGRALNDSELTEETFKTKNIQGVGGYLYEGQLVMEMNWEMYQFIKENQEKFENMDGFDSLGYYEVVYDTTEYGTINKDDLPDGELAIITGEMDHHSPNSVGDLKECLDEY